MRPTTRPGRDNTRANASARLSVDMSSTPGAKKTCRVEALGVLLHLQAKEDPSRRRRVAAVVHSRRVVAHDLAPVLCRRSIEPARRSVEAPATVDVDEVAISCARQRASLR